MENVGDEVDGCEETIVGPVGFGSTVEEELGEEDEGGRSLDGVVDVSEVPGFLNGRAKAPSRRGRREGRGGADEIGEFGEEEGDSEEGQRSLQG